MYKEGDDDHVKPYLTPFFVTFAQTGLLCSSIAPNTPGKPMQTATVHAIFLLFAMSIRAAALSCATFMIAICSIDGRKTARLLGYVSLALDISTLLAESLWFLPSTTDSSGSILVFILTYVISWFVFVADYRIMHYELTGLRILMM